MASIAVASAMVVVVDSDEVRRSVVYTRYNNGPRTLPRGMPTLSEDSSVLSFNLYEEVSPM
jgi:hypothetical protein